MFAISAKKARVSQIEYTMIDYKQVRYWVDDLPKRGRTTFSVKEAEDQFPFKPASSVRRALARLSDAGKIHSVWKGFYAISLPEYGLEGIAPPSDYIDQLMDHLDSKYYVALLTAASYRGAAHQAPQSFFVICEKNLHVKKGNEVKLELVFKKKISENYISVVNSRTASIKVSTPELTAIDLVTYMKRVGGINNVATVLAELTESMDFEKVEDDFFEGAPVASIQRLGFVLDDVLGERRVAESLYIKAKQSGMRFKTIPLINSKNNLESTKKNARWGVDVNYEVESDL